jgi:hypothetical protein
MDAHVTIEELLEAVFSMMFLPKLYSVDYLLVREDVTQGLLPQGLS